MNKQTHRQVVILSIPHLEQGYASAAPVLLSACLNDAGISAVGLDFAAKFRDYFSQFEEDYIEMVNWMCVGYLGLRISKHKQMIKFIDNYLKEVVAPFDPEWVGLSAFTNQSLNFVELMSGRVRRIFPNAKLVIGGLGLENISKETNRYYYEDYHDAGLADLIIVGDAEFSFVKAVKENATGLIVSKEQTSDDLNNIPIPNWKDSFNIANVDKFPYVTVTGSKGCIRNCTFCDVNSYWPKFIQRDGTKIADEIISIYEQTGNKDFYFTDNLINASVSNYRKLNQRLLEVLPPQTVKYYGYAIFRSANLMPERDFELAAEAGAHNWIIGVESGSERVRVEQGKKVTDHDLDWTARMLHKYKIQQRWSLFIGYPTETEEDFELTLDMLRRYAFIADDGLLLLSLNKPFMALDNSPIFNHFTMDQPDTDPWRQYFWTCKEHPDNIFEVRAERWYRAYELMEQLGAHWWIPGEMHTFKLELENLEKFYHNEYKNATSPLPY